MELAEDLVDLLEIDLQFAAQILLQPGLALLLIHLQTHGVVVLRDAVGVVVPGHGVGADAGGVEVEAQKGGDLGFAHTGAAVDGDYRAVGILCPQPLHQEGKDGLGLADMFFADLHLVSRHVPVGDLVGKGRELPGV